MTGEHLESILKTRRQGGEGRIPVVPDGAALTLYVAHDGVSLTVSRVEGIRVDGEIVYARTAKRRRTPSVVRIFAVAIEGAVGQPVRARASAEKASRAPTVIRFVAFFVALLPWRVALLLGALIGFVRGPCSIRRPPHPGRDAPRGISVMEMVVYRAASIARSG